MKQNERHMNYHLTIPERLDGRQWKTILRSEFGASERLLRQLARNNAITVSGQSVYLTARAKAGDIMTLELPAETSSVPPEQGPLSIAYEDQEIIVANKAPGVLTHPSAREKHGSLLAAAARYLQPKGQVPHCVHRLDRDTSGLVMLAKHAHFHHLYDLALRRGLVHRTYAAIIQTASMAGQPLRIDDGWQTVDLPVATDPSAPSKRVIDVAGQRAVTHFCVIAHVKDYAMVGVILETGRTHQIRLHFSEIGTPLAGEPYYQQGSGQRANLPGGLLNRRPTVSLRRQALHASVLRWQHPISGELRTTSALPPADMVEFWMDLGGHENDFHRVMALADGPVQPYLSQPEE